MKIVCDSCSTKYSISDDKVRGKVFKIRCKKCSHIIVVKGTSEAVAAPEAPADAVWHLVVEGDQVGPLPDADVRARLLRNEISVENYVWKEGFADWLRLADVPEFSDVASSLPVGAPAPAAGELFSEVGNNEVTNTGHAANPAATDFGAFFGAGAAGQEAARAATGGASGRTRAAAPVATAPEEDAFSVPVAGPAVDGADLFGAVAPIAAQPETVRGRGRPSNGTAPGGRHDGGRVESLTAQRSENSVLFSLSNLQSLAAPPSASKANSNSIAATDGSGLIDIRAMAASTLRAPVGGGMPLFGDQAQGSQEELPAFGAFPSAAPMLLGIPSSSGPPKWVYALIGVTAVMLIAVVALAFSILGKPVVVDQPAPAPVPQVVAPAVRGAGTAEETPPVVVASKAVPEGDLPPRENGTPALGERGAEKTGSDKTGVKVFKKLKGKRLGGGDPKSLGGAGTVAPAAAAAEPEKAKPAKGSLDDLLEGALNGRKGRPKVEDDTPGKKSPEGAGSGPLAKGAVVAGMNGVKGKISACYALYKVPGLVMVNVAIGKSGKVSAATVTGKFAGTPTGACVESAVKTASFPPSDGLNTPYPFTLR
jgi:predicted Zn finger-like uncharacterized protein